MTIKLNLLFDNNKVMNMSNLALNALKTSFIKDPEKKFIHWCGR